MSKKEIAFEVFKTLTLMDLIEDLGLNTTVLKWFGLSLSESNSLLSLFLLLVLADLIFDYISKDWE